MSVRLFTALQAACPWQLVAGKHHESPQSPLIQAPIDGHLSGTSPQIPL